MFAAIERCGGARREIIGNRRDQEREVPVDAVNPTHGGVALPHGVHEIPRRAVDRADLAAERADDFLQLPIVSASAPID